MVKNIFIHYTEIIFLNKTQWSLTCAEYVVLFSELHDEKTERSMSCKELFNKQCPFIQYRKKWKHMILILI